MYTCVLAADISGLSARIIRIEVDVNDGLPVFDMVGFLASSVKEARERVRIAVRNLGIRFPAKRVTINLSPANLRKDGTSFDLPIAVALLHAFGYIKNAPDENTMFVGELGLDGSVRAVRGVLAMLLEGRETGVKKFIVPADNAYEGSILDDVSVIGVSSLKEVMDFMNEEVSLTPVKPDPDAWKDDDSKDDFSEISGQEEAKFAAQIAVSGRHNILFIGPPGSGKSMLAGRIPTIMPKLTLEECLSITKIYSICGALNKDKPLITRRPFRAPHHTITQTALTGGGRIPTPGEITLASKGILFLDELPEFAKQTIEVLRQPMEDGKVTISRLEGSEEYPSDCIFMAAMNPCRCGYFPDLNKCRCTINEIHRYLDKISEPLLDRMDMSVEMSVPKFALYGRYGESSEQIREKVEKTIEIQQKRYLREPFSYNGDLGGRDLEKYCPLGDEQMQYLRDYFEEEDVSFRRLTRIIRVARTIADSEGETDINTDHLAVAISLRSINKKYWGGDRL
ncbi:MAG: YifB family Mg chelatase-like AAA ATPase [Eubacterium sp.]|nr:YifB family Mg chelatase-like AAA ATPase [Eubacterium sp.]